MILLTVVTIVLAFLFAAMWILSFVSNPGIVDNNPFIQKLGYNSF